MRSFSGYYGSIRPLVMRLVGSGLHSDAQRRAIIAFAIRVASAAIAYLSQVFLARAMGAHEFGIFAYVWVWVVILGTFANVGLNTSCMRFIPEYFERREWGLLRGFLNTGIGIALGGGILACVTGIAAILIFEDAVQSYYAIPLILAFVCLPGFTLSDIMDGMARSRGWIHLALVPAYIARPVLILAFMALSIGAGGPATATTALLSAIAATSLIALIQTLMVYRRLTDQIPESGKSYNVGTWVTVSLPLLMMDGFALIMMHADIIILNLFVGPDQLAIYYALIKTTSLISFVLFAVSASFGPMFAELQASGRNAELPGLLRTAILCTFWPTLAGAIGILVIGMPLLSLFGSEFVIGYPAMFVLVFGLLVRASTGPIEIMLTMLGHQNLVAVTLAVAMAVNIVLNLLLIPPYGLMGAAIATTLSTCALSFLQYVLARQKLGVHAFIVGGHKNDKALAHA